MPIRGTRKRCWTQGEGFYLKMLSHHKSLWAFLERFTKALEIRRILEVGGGLGLVSEWCVGKRGLYLNIERNPTITKLAMERYLPKKTNAEFIVDDFVAMDTRQFQAQHFGMVLAAGVIEHCPSYQEFIHRCLEVDPTFVVITFFRSLLWEEDRICRMISPEGVYYENHYMIHPMIEWLKTEGLEYYFYTIKKRAGEVILIIDAHGGQGDKISAAVASVGMVDEGWGEWARPQVMEKLRARRERANVAGGKASKRGK